MGSIWFCLAYLEAMGHAVSLCHNQFARNKGLVPFYALGFELAPYDSMLDVLAKSPAFVLHELYDVSVVTKQSVIKM